MNIDSTVLHPRRELPGFNEYFNNLTDKYLKEENPRNPWYEEYYKTYCKCSEAEENTANPSIMCNVNSKKRSKRVHQAQQPYIHFVRDAVYAFAHAIDNLVTNTCGNHSGQLCPEYHQVSHHDLIKYLHNVTFNDVDNFPFKFESNTHDGPPRYSIISYIETEEGLYDWKEVGTYQNGIIRNLDEAFRVGVHSQSKQNNFVTCKQDTCPVDQIEIPDGFNDGCCWHCQGCHDWEYKKSEFECHMCPDDMIRNKTHPKV